jgi:Flp pilus assembly pilin Flp
MTERHQKGDFSRSGLIIRQFSRIVGIESASHPRHNRGATDSSSPKRASTGTRRSSFPLRTPKRSTGALALTIPKGSALIDSLNQTVEAVKNETGQTMAEYAVVLGVITIAVVVTLGLLSTAIKSTLSNVIASL